MFRGALGSGYGLSEVIVKAIPLVISGVAVALAFRMKVWNIGAEGQIYLGAFSFAALFLFFLSINQVVMLLAMTAAAIMAGGAWGYIAGFLKSRWNVNEVITTLMLNYVGIHLADHFIYGPWRDPSSLGFPMTPPFPPSARLPLFFGTRVHLGVLAAVLLVLLFRLVIRWTRWGFEIRAIGDNPRAAEYAGINYGRNVALLMFISGAIAGLAGMTEIAGLQGRLQPGFSPGYGYTAIISRLAGPAESMGHHDGPPSSWGSSCWRRHYPGHNEASSCERAGHSGLYPFLRTRFRILQELQGVAVEKGARVGWMSLSL